MKLDESSTILLPAVYNRLGLQGDFEVYTMAEGLLSSLSGRRGPYTSIREWFSFAGKSILGKPPEYVKAALTPDSGRTFQFYKITSEQAGNLEAIADSLEPEPMPDLVII